MNFSLMVSVMNMSRPALVATAKMDTKTYMVPQVPIEFAVVAMGRRYLSGWVGGQPSSSEMKMGGREELAAVLLFCVVVMVVVIVSSTCS